ncbi:pyruvate dehydrogenase [Rhodobacteraceae bacterium N5(2021)]|uniref:Pyruvate dehydrogenase n=1 Tax=Gymnodinialimonas phycosphaerae TaxID=2841589 RepID=A0A975TWX7_9RHOB|nr:biotin/lipoyl-containing protein [Gymnodinialimonas phycosphaerae]MBY4891954.1 pyruvate dehydrogenase [Gymnodinialimonas phycosphaerae]
MPHDVTMPQLGMAQDAGKIVSWLKAEGDEVAKGDALLEVETDKAVMEVEAQASGYLTGVSAAAGADVPVGQVIARISESADAPDATPASDVPEAPGADGALPDGKEITMPQLGMAQDSAVLIGWHAAPGDAVDADDILFEVETDKSTMEVPAGTSGFLAATLAAPGDDVPVGVAVAIISAKKPDAPVARGVAGATRAPVADIPAETADAAAPKAPPASEPAPASKPGPWPPVAPAPDGKILASPKARRLARERGLDLARLVAAGHPQPYHVADLEALAVLPVDAPAPIPASGMQLTASIATDGLAEFATWAAQAHGLTDANALLAGLAGASLPDRKGATVAISRHGTLRGYDVPSSRALSQVAPSDTAPDLSVRDLRGTALRRASIGVEETPVLTLTSAQDGGLTLTLECGPDQLAPDQAIHLLTQFAARMEQPLHHLL